jgi:indolepyruvate ferredoxin oxidoreductase alpha subunit
MKEKDIVVMGDIGCYSLGIAAPHNILSCAFEMGSGISSANGLGRPSEGPDKIILLHRIHFPPCRYSFFLNAVYNKSSITVIIITIRRQP